MPYTSFPTLSWSQVQVQLTCYNGLRSMEMRGTPAPGASSGSAMKAAEAMTKKLPSGVEIE